MTSFSRPLLLLALGLSVGFLSLEALPPGRAESSAESCLLRLVREQQHREALECLTARTLESLETMRAIVHKLIHREITLQEALDAYSEVYAQLYFVRSWRAEGKEVSLTREKTFELIFSRAQEELMKEPDRARRIGERLWKEWRSLRAEADGRDIGPAY